MSSEIRRKERQAIQQRNDTMKPPPPPKIVWHERDTQVTSDKLVKKRVRVVTEAEAKP